MPYNNDIAAALIGRLDPDIAIDREVLRAAVARQLTDNENGAVLDAHHAVLVTATPAGGRAVMEVFDAARWDTVAEGFTLTAQRYAVTVTTIDGRVVFGEQAHQ